MAVGLATALRRGAARIRPEDMEEVEALTRAWVEAFARWEGDRSPEAWRAFRAARRAARQANQAALGRVVADGREARAAAEAGATRE